MYDKLALAADDPLRDGIRLLNPLGDDTSVMRTTAVGSLLGALSYNRSRRIPACALFENATVYAQARRRYPRRPVFQGRKAARVRLLRQR